MPYININLGKVRRGHFIKQKTLISEECSYIFKSEKKNFYKTKEMFLQPLILFFYLYTSHKYYGRRL